MRIAAAAILYFAIVFGVGFSRVLMGIGALLLQQVADLAVGLILRDMSLGEQFAQFASPQGLIYAALLVLFAVMPWLISRRAA